MLGLLHVIAPNISPCWQGSDIHFSLNKAAKLAVNVVDAVNEFMQHWHAVNSLPLAWKALQTPDWLHCNSANADYKSYISLCMHSNGYLVCRYMIHHICMHVTANLAAYAQIAVGVDSGGTHLTR